MGRLGSSRSRGRWAAAGPGGEGEPEAGAGGVGGATFPHAGRARDVADATLGPSSPFGSDGRAGRRRPSTCFAPAERYASPDVDDRDAVIHETRAAIGRGLGGAPAWYTSEMAAAHLDVEKKYAADESFELPPLAELVAGPAKGAGAAVDPGTPVAEGEAERQRLETTYFDTADLRLATAGLTLRRRTGGDDPGWHLEVPARTGARSGVRLPLGRATRTVPEALRNMVWAHSRGAPLRPVAEISTDRTVRRLFDATGQVLAELADDRVTARRLRPTNGSGDATGAARSWRAIEVELVVGRPELLDTVDTRLRALGLREAAPSSELAQLLDGDEHAGPSERKAAKLTTTSAAGDVVLTHVREQVEQMRSQDLPVRLDAPDAVHKMRVATRRLRS